MEPMDWSNETIIEFLELYKTYPCIWDPKHKYHKNRIMIAQAWIDIKKSLGLPCSVKHLKKKKESLMASYRAYKRKIKISSLLGTGEVYQPTWYAFALIDDFLGSIYHNSSTVTTQYIKKKKRNKNTSESINVTDAIFEIESDELPKEDSQAQKKSTHKESFEQSSSKQGFSKSKRKSHSPVHQQANMDKQQQHRNNSDDDDECDLFGRFIAKRLRRLPETQRDLLIYKINSLMYENLSCSNCDQQKCTEASTPSPSDIVPSPLVAYKQEH